MKKILLTFLFGVLIYSCTSTRIENDKTKYFDENNVEISKSKFKRIRSTNKRLDIQGDSIHHKKLILREKQGKLSNKTSLVLLLEKELNQEIDSMKPIVIIYYPGKDPCNSGGSAPIESRLNWYAQLENGINQIAQTKPIYIYKEKDGLEKYDSLLTWHKDPEGKVEKLFFEYHYPCSSFVVISKDGNYISYFGEFAKEYVWEATRLMNK